MLKTCIFEILYAFEVHTCSTYNFKDSSALRRSPSGTIFPSLFLLDFPGLFQNGLLDPLVPLVVSPGALLHPPAPGVVEQRVRAEDEEHSEGVGDLDPVILPEPFDPVDQVHQDLESHLSKWGTTGV